MSAVDIEFSGASHREARQRGPSSRLRNVNAKYPRPWASRMNKAQAEAIVKEKVLRESHHCALIEGATQEFEKCFAVYIQSHEYIDSGDSADMLIGLGPVLVAKTTSEVYETGSAYPTEHYVTAFEACGNPFGEPTDTIALVGSSKSVEKISAIKYLSRITDHGTGSAKAQIDSMIDGEEVVISLNDQESVAAVIKELSAMGIVSRQVWRIRG